MSKKINEDPDSWHHYHKLRRESMKDWEEIPYEEIAKQITCETDKIIDFGCGDNQFKDCVKNQVTSVDHIAIDDTVIACDMSDLSQYVENESHDVAVFSLSLWGTNSQDYLKEAYRILVRKGMIYIAEPSKDYIDGEKQNEMISLLNEIGFKIVGKFDIRNKFTYITGIKI
jgi:ribosomal RNA-processing protein 8